MCGIVGIVSGSDVVERIIDGLRHLEYRGYDSAGIAVSDEGRIVRRRAAGKIGRLADLLQDSPITGRTGIGHTRWATHGAATERNAHPHATERVAVAHNGIIENYAQLRRELEERDVVFESETDTEVIVHLVDRGLRAGLSPREAFFNTLKRLEGAFALAVICRDYPEQLLGARRGSPLIAGLCGRTGDYCLASDPLAVASWVEKISYLEDGDAVVCERDAGVTVYDERGEPRQRVFSASGISGMHATKGGYRHFMLKEIHEQPQTVADTFRSLWDEAAGQVCRDGDLAQLIDRARRIKIIACGTSYYAALCGRYWLEEYAGVGVDVEIASEFRYRRGVLEGTDLMIFISQSGETVDTLAALEYAKTRGIPTLSVVNVRHSSIMRRSDFSIVTSAGREIGVASTKAFTAQLTVLLALAMRRMPPAEAEAVAAAFAHLPGKIASVLRELPQWEKIAGRFAAARDVLYLGRGTNYPIALEGALKLKELSYIHAEGYAAGELKHGPIALVDPDVIVVALAPCDAWFEKTVSNVQETLARGAQVLLITDPQGKERLPADERIRTVVLPANETILNPILYSIPVQLLAYAVAVMRGTDVDQPRNLAKSVTVE